MQIMKCENIEYKFLQRINQGEEFKKKNAEIRNEIM